MKWQMIHKMANVLPIFIAIGAQTFAAELGGLSGPGLPGPGVPGGGGSATTFGDPDCNCVETYEDGSTNNVLSCDGFQEDCCQLDEDGECPDENYLVSCECVCSELVSVEYDDGHFIRGVPTLFQHNAGPASPLCGGWWGVDMWVGCGPIAGAALVAWYDQLGFNRLGNGFRTGGRLDWQGLAERLGEGDLMGSWCVPFSGSPVQTATPLWAVRSGIRDWTNGLQGYGFTFSNVVRVRQGEEPLAYDNIKDHIDNNQPVLILYCTDEAGCEGGIGITDSAIDDWSNSTHIGLITGYFEVGDEQHVYITTGWGAGGNETREFRVGLGSGAGSIRLVYVTPNWNQSTESTWCSADSLSGSMQDADDIGFSCSESEYDDLVVLENIEGTECDRIGDIHDGTITRTWGMGGHCMTPDIAETFPGDLPDLDLADWVGLLE
jgi:hypothetical protein